MGIENGVGLSYNDYRAMNGRQIVWRLVKEANGSFTHILEFNGKRGIFPSDDPEDIEKHSKYLNAESYLRAINVVSNGDGTATGTGHLIVAEDYFTFALAMVPMVVRQGRHKGKNLPIKKQVCVFKAGKIADYLHSEATV